MRKISSLLFFFCVSCGESPLFNHVEAQNSQSHPIQSITAQATCDLSFKNLLPPLCASVQASGPYVLGQSVSWTLVFWQVASPSQISDPPGDLSALAAMPSMPNMQVPQMTIQKLSPGTFITSAVFLSMPEDWVAQFSLKNGSQQLDQASLLFNVSSSSSAGK